ncbi:N-acetyltransferase [Chitinimonas viridis]|uniref:N-acetyltransferase n=1 Tax=Chitinimonas viridis TaxID=664880 RepID=A0ABT8AZY7_9NEIS|nr:N-acetyltransferase [Chitinimonas viridis]MDN3575418.1 N-acetyltransferase [Chitinimonas viridis]
MTAIITSPLANWPATAVHALMREVYATSDAMSETFEDKFPDFEAFVQQRQDWLAMPGAVALVAHEADTLLGYILLMPRQQARLHHTADLNMGVHPAARGKGVGRLLLAATLQAARAQGLLEIAYLMVRADNTAAVKLYEAAGFTCLAVLERDTQMDGRYYDGLLMRHWLQPPGDGAWG